MNTYRAYTAVYDIVEADNGNMPEGEFKALIKSKYGLEGHPLFDRAYALAYEIGHSFGKLEVLHHFDDLAPLLTLTGPYWIPVTESLPDNQRLVQVCWVKHSVSEDAIQMTTSTTTTGRWAPSTGWKLAMFHSLFEPPPIVTHWAELLKPYKGDEK